jgi:predicted Ser/Thr protein kinase
LSDRIGVGGMAEVYDAVDQRLRRPVAVKLLRPQLAVQSELRRRFEAEARVAARISHPNVVAVYDTGEDEGRAFIVMERVAGESLGAWLQRGPLDQAWVRWLAEDILAALAAAHHAGVLHRDIKPANILITADGRAKVTDFGIAKSVEMTASDLTATGLVMGTPAYLAPERLQGRAATQQSDLYAAGMVLYEALTGYRRPLGADPVANAAAMGQPLPDPRVVRPDADPALVDAIERALATNPAARWPTAAAMTAALAPTQAITGFRAAPPAPTQAITGVTAAPPAPTQATAAVVAAPPHPTYVTEVAGVPSTPPAPNNVNNVTNVTEVAEVAVAAGPLRRRGSRWRLPAAATVAFAVLLSMTLVLASGSHPDRSPGRATAPAAPKTTTAPTTTPTTPAPVTTAPAASPTTAPPTTATPAKPVTANNGAHGNGNGHGQGDGGGGGGGD